MTLKCIGMQNLIDLYHVIQKLWASDHEMPDLSSAESCHRFAHKCFDNVKMYKFAKFDSNIWCGSRVISIFTKRPWPAKMMIGKASSTFWHTYQWQDNVKINKRTIWSKFTLRFKTYEHFSNWPILFEMMLSKASSINKALRHASG